MNFGKMFEIKNNFEKVLIKMSVSFEKTLQVLKNNVKIKKIILWTNFDKGQSSLPLLPRYITEENA